MSKKYKRIYIGRGIKPTDKCDVCGESGYLGANWIARENTMTWCGPYFSVKHGESFVNDQGFVEWRNLSNHYVGIKHRKTFPELGKEPPTIEWMERYRYEKGFASIPEHKETQIRKMKRLRAEIRENLMSLGEEDLHRILQKIHFSEGGEATPISED